MNHTLSFYVKKVYRPGDDIQRVRQKVCQDILISKLTDVDFLSAHVVFKGGIVMYELTKGSRGYTKDIDLDFVQMPLSIQGINDFIDGLNQSTRFDNIRIHIESIEDLHHINYHGKRVLLHFIDQQNATLPLMVDIGIHVDRIGVPGIKPYEVKLTNETVNIVIDANELSIVEKLTGFALYGTDNLRFKDLFDLYWRIMYLDYELMKVKAILDEKLVFRGFFKTRRLAIREMINALQNKAYIAEIKKEKNWTKQSVESICRIVIGFIEKLQNE